MTGWRNARHLCHADIGGLSPQRWITFGRNHLMGRARGTDVRRGLAGPCAVNELCNGGLAVISREHPTFLRLHGSDRAERGNGS
jgi:hypothetical protein